MSSKSALFLHAVDYTYFLNRLASAHFLFDRFANRAPSLWQLASFGSPLRLVLLPATLFEAIQLLLTCTTRGCVAAPLPTFLILSFLFDNRVPPLRKTSGPAPQLEPIRTPPYSRPTPLPPFTPFAQLPLQHMSPHLRLPLLRGIFHDTGCPTLRRPPRRPPFLPVAIVFSHF